MVAIVKEKSKPMIRAEQNRIAEKAAIWAARIALAAVFVVNVHCAVQFVIWPDAFASSFELTGMEGAVAVRGLGVAFLMWNATYPLAIIDPVKYRALFGVVIAQQVIGLVGESSILFSLPPGNGPLVGSITRFVAFDAAGLIIMTAAFVALAISLKRKRTALGID